MKFGYGIDRIVIYSSESRETTDEWIERKLCGPFERLVVGDVLKGEEGGRSICGNKGYDGRVP